MARRRNYKRDARGRFARVAGKRGSAKRARVKRGANTFAHVHIGLAAGGASGFILAGPAGAIPGAAVGRAAFTRARRKDQRRRGDTAGLRSTITGRRLKR